MTRAARLRNRALTIACEVGLSLAHVAEAIADEWSVLRERLRDP